MDRTLLSYMNLGKADALLEIKKMIDQVRLYNGNFHLIWHNSSCLLYTSDAADERSSVDLGGRRIIKKKKKE